MMTVSFAQSLQSIRLAAMMRRDHENNAFLLVNFIEKAP